MTSYRVNYSISLSRVQGLKVVIKLKTQHCNAVLSFLANSLGKNIDHIWESIKRHSGETFKTVKGITYDFHVEGEYIKLYNTN